MLLYRRLNISCLLVNTVILYPTDLENGRSRGNSVSDVAIGVPIILILVAIIAVIAAIGMYIYFRYYRSKYSEFCRYMLS